MGWEANFRGKSNGMREDKREADEKAMNNLLDCACGTTQAKKITCQEFRLNIGLEGSGVGGGGRVPCNDVVCVGWQWWVGAVGWGRSTPPSSFCIPRRHSSFSLSKPDPYPYPPIPTTLSLPGCRPKALYIPLPPYGLAALYTLHPSV